MTRCCAVLVTDESTVGDLPIDGEPLTLLDIEMLLDETEAVQKRVLDAIETYAVRPDPKTGKSPRKPRSGVRPAFSLRPSASQFSPTEDSATQRALATANFVGASWSHWLAAEEERRSRAVSPKGETPWMMPTELSALDAPNFPDGFATRLTEQPLV